MRILSICFLIGLFNANGFCQSTSTDITTEDIKCPVSDYAQCQNYLDSLLYNTTTEEHSIRGKIYEELGRLNYKVSKLVKSKSYFDSSYVLYVKSEKFLEAYEMGVLSIYSLADNGDIVSAEKKALELQEEITKHTPDNLEAGSLINNLLGNVYSMQRRHLEALEKRKKCLEIRESYLPDNSELIAYAYSNLSQTYRSIGQIDKAEEMMLSGFEILKKAVPDTDPGYLLELYNIGAFYYVINKNEEANKYFKTAFDTYVEKGDTLSTNYIYTVNGYSSGLRRVGDFQKSYEIAIKNPTLKLKTKIPTSVYLNQQFNLGKTAVGIPNLELANYHYETVAQDLIDFYTFNSQISTQENLIDETRGFIQFTTGLASFVNQNPNIKSKIPTLLNDLILLQKGLGLERESRLNKNLNASNNELFEQWKNKKIELNKKYTSASQDEVAQLEDEVQEIQKSLLISGIGEEISPNWIKTEDIQRAINEKDIAIEFTIANEVEYENFRQIPSKVYYAYITNKKETKILRLFKEEDIEKAFNSTERKNNYVNQLYAVADRGLVTRGDEINLFNLIIKPLQPYLEGIERIYYAPDGFLHRVNLGAIEIDDEVVLADEYQIYALGSTRKILENPIKQSISKEILLIGGIDFGVLPESSNTLRGATNATTWKNLKHTAKEVEEILEISKVNDFNNKVLDSNLATEKALYNYLSDNSPKIIHIATHGFFLNADRNSENIFSNISNPMMRSGLLLSNGNNGWNGNTDEDGYDNILTAAEIAELDLNGTELVILSACETGLGDISNLQGVFGLQRAFKIAGVKYIIMSLWKVPDRQTRQFMTSFYENYIDQNLNIREAFINTQREMKDRFFDPYSWAGFVLIE